MEVCLVPKALVIVESPAKAKTIEKFLGKSHYTVKASVGHVRDLPKSRLGVDIENNFEPEYINIRGKGDVIKDLKKEAKKASKVYLATDPDREGEAISWHLSYILGIDNDSACRIEFNEITKDTIKKSIKMPRKINHDLVDAQQARRVLDRLLGYQISPILWQKVRRGLSAGRVQSVTTKLICDREKEIEAFVPEEYWTLVLVCNIDGTMVEFSFYENENIIADLDVDDTTSYGPETLTLYQSKPGKIYHYYVHDYINQGLSDSNEMSNSGARLSIFVDGLYRETMYIPTNKAGTVWHAFDYNPDTKEIIKINQDRKSVV